jgi:hypothetical protein
MAIQTARDDKIFLGNVLKFPRKKQNQIKTTNPMKKKIRKRRTTTTPRERERE